MGMHNGQYYLSNSEMNDWLTMCPRVWKAKYIDRHPLLNQESEDVTAMDWGVLFETLAIGSGVAGKTIPEVKLKIMQRSEYYLRVSEQAKACRGFFKALGGKIIARQPYLYTIIKDGEGNDLNICGGLDLLMEFEDRNLIIDTKLTGDNDNDFGKYQFGNVDKIKPQQGVHYTILHDAVYNKPAGFNYFVFDKSPSLKRKIINVTVSEMGRAMHIDLCAQVYGEITMALSLDDFDYKNTYDNCRDCPVACNRQRLLPDVYEINA